MVKTIARAWRHLTRHTAGHLPRTLIACSGGADSMALVLAMVAIAAEDAAQHLALACIRHDMRTKAEVEKDVAAVGALARSLHVPIFVGDALAGGDPRTENAYRNLRYTALAKIARDNGYAFVATAHHADDQLESLLMALARGSGPAGLRGIAPRRTIDDDSPRVLLIRPMLRTSHADAIRLCNEHDITWREDATNADPSHLRAALRHGPVAQLTELLPHAGSRAAHTASLMRDLTHLLDDLAEAVFVPPAGPWPRERLRALPRAVLSHGLRKAVVDANTTGADRVSARAITPIVRMIRSSSGASKCYTLARGATITVTSEWVTLK